MFSRIIDAQGRNPDAKELVDRIKARVPIWKEQHLGDGGRQWVNL